MRFHVAALDARIVFELALGRIERVAQRHGAKARAIAEAVEKSLVSSGIEARLRMTGDWR